MSIHLKKKKSQTSFGVSFVNLFINSTLFKFMSCLLAFNLLQRSSKLKKKIQMLSEDWWFGWQYNFFIFFSFELKKLWLYFGVVVTYEGKDVRLALYVDVQTNITYVALPGGYTYVVDCINDMLHSCVLRRK